MLREKGLALLRSQGWLSGQPPEFQESFLAHARWKRIERNTIITLGGEEKDDVVGVAQGTVGITATLGEAEAPMLHMAHAVFWMGYGPLLLERPRVVTVTAKTDLWIAVVPKVKILPLLDETTQWWRAFSQLLGEYGDISSVIAADLLIRQSDRRLAATILRFAGFRGPNPKPDAEVRLPVTQAELADAANLSRNAANAIIRNLMEEGFIRTEYGGVVVLNADGLKQILSGR
jgi:CRP-like cAMP-binding protein